ncbi:MAG: hypothetical protein WD896_00210 [Parcubacteria group bacterium]
MKKNGGQALVVVTVIFTIVAIGAVLGVTSPIVSQLAMAKTLESSKKSYFTAEAGSEDAFYRVRNNLPALFPLTLTLDGAVAITNMDTVGLNEQQIISEGNANDHIRTVLKDITVSDGFSFHSAVQVGIGGLNMLNTSKVIGNVYSEGPIKSNDSGTRIAGDAVSSGAGGVIEAANILGTAYAHEIKGNTKICGDAHYQIINSSSLNFLNSPASPCSDPLTPGTAYPTSPDQLSLPMPISDDLLDQWESDAVSGGVINSPCPYKITSGTVTLGPVKINCDFEVGGNGTVIIMAGAIWVNGNFTINNNPKFKVSDSLGNKSVPLVVRSASNPTQRGLITLNNNPEFYGSESGGTPNPDSYVMLVSRNTGALAGTGDKAIISGNNVTGNLLLYAPHGEIELSNNVILRAVTAHTLTLKNNVEVHYTIGLSQTMFTSGPGGQWKVKRWQEI